MKGWGINNQLKNPLGYLEAITRRKVNLWKSINRLSGNFEEADLSCSILEKYQRRLKSIKEAENE